MEEYKPSQSSRSSEVEIQKEFEDFLKEKSWSSSAAERFVFDRFFATHREGQGWTHPRRQVLLLATNGSIVLGYHNENNDAVWAQSGRAKDGGDDMYRDSWSREDIVVGEIPGYIEYLETLLTEDGTCGHSPLIQRTEYFEIPARLCFFNQWASPDRGVTDDIFYVDTENLCRDCYQKAVPRGFNVWSTSYFDRYNEKVDRDYYDYFRKCHLNSTGPRTYDSDSSSFLRLYWPRCFRAKSRELAFENEAYPRMPGATIAHECWRWLVWNRAPFYIDQLCVSPSYKIFKDPEQVLAENQRISKLNASAYIGAAHGILGIPPGGRGEYTMVELRILGKRALLLPEDFGDAAALTSLGPGYIVHGDNYWVPPQVRYSGRLKRDPDHSEIAMRQVIEDQSRAPSERMPDESKVLNELILQIGKPLGPTPEEVERVRQFPMRDYPETVRKYNELLACLKDRMSETTAPVSKRLHPTVEQANTSRQLEKNVDTPIQILMESLKLSDEPESSKYLNDSILPKNVAVFFKPFAGRPRSDAKQDSERESRGSGRPNRLYCHDSSSYVFRGPFQVRDYM